MDLLTIEEMAKELRVKSSWLYDKTRRKGPEAIPHLRIGKYCRFRLPEVLAWAEKQQKARGN